MAGKPSQMTSSGIEPIDKLLGGLQIACLYLAHGEATSCSLFGVRFAIEGLRRGEPAAMVVGSSPEEIVRQFAHLGYDCLEDVYSGRLVILEYSGDIIEQITHISALAPVLKELEWLFGETRPHRIVFDPVDRLLVGKEGNPLSRAGEFADWAAQFGATALLIARNRGTKAVEIFRPLVEESFRFEIKEKAEEIVRLITFEKDDSMPSQKIEVDPSRGIFLVESSDQTDHLFIFAEMEEPVTNTDTSEPQPSSPPQTIESIDEQQRILELFEKPPVYLKLPFDLIDETEAEEIFSDIPVFSTHPAPSPTQVVSANSVEEVSPVSEQPPSSEIELDWLNELVEELGEDFFATEEGAPPALTVADTGSASSSAPAIIDNVIQTTQRADESLPIASALVEPLLNLPDEAVAPLPAIIAAHAARGPARKSEKSDDISEIDPAEFTVLLIHTDPAECEAIAQSLDHYDIEIVHDGVSALSRLISLKPDLVILSLDLPIIDGFEVLSHIRRSLNVPVITISATRQRAGDRILASEMGADYFLTRPHSSKELRQKARQLIARYRGINQWIVTSYTLSASGERAHSHRGEMSTLPRATEKGLFLPYEVFSAEVESRVKTAIEHGPAISIVGCSLPQMAAEGGKIALQLFDLMRSTARDTDRISSNQKNDLVVLLPDADSVGGQAFAKRLRERVRSSLNQEPAIWLRSFPEPQQGQEAAPFDLNLSNGHKQSRRAGDKKH